PSTSGERSLGLTSVRTGCWPLMGSFAMRRELSLLLTYQALSGPSQKASTIGERSPAGFTWTVMPTHTVSFAMRGELSPLLTRQALPAAWHKASTIGERSPAGTPPTGWALVVSFAMPTRLNRHRGTKHQQRGGGNTDGMGTHGLPAATLLSPTRTAPARLA